MSVNLKWTFYIRDLKHWWQMGRRRRPPGVAKATKNATAHARLITHKLSRTWKPAGWRPAVNLSKFTRIITPLPKFTFLKEISSQLHFRLLTYLSLYFCTKNTRKLIDIGVREQAPVSCNETFFFVFSSFWQSKKVYRSKRC